MKERHLRVAIAIERILFSCSGSEVRPGYIAMKLAPHISHALARARDDVLDGGLAGIESLEDGVVP